MVMLEYTLYFSPTLLDRDTQSLLPDGFHSTPCKRQVSVSMAVKMMLVFIQKDINLPGNTWKETRKGTGSLCRSL